MTPLFDPLPLFDDPPYEFVELLPPVLPDAPIEPLLVLLVVPLVVPLCVPLWPARADVPDRAPDVPRFEAVRFFVLDCDELLLVDDAPDARRVESVEVDWALAVLAIPRVTTAAMPQTMKVDARFLMVFVSCFYGCCAPT